MPLLQTADVTVHFGGVTALDSVNLTAHEGTITGLIGPNGAGKTTMFNVITGLQAPSSGRVMFAGDDITSVPVHRRARLGMARTFQRLELFGSLTVRENIRAGAEIRLLWSRERIDINEQTEAVLAQVGLLDEADEPAHTLPTGLARLTELGRALATRPRLLLLDEPGSGLDTKESEAFGRLLGRLTADGTGILLVEHDMDLIMEVCSQIHVLDFGVHVMSGPPDQVRSDPRVQEAYLGQPPDGGSELAEVERATVLPRVAR